MKIGFVVNDVLTEQAGYTTTRLAMTATKLGHEAWLLGVADFVYAPDGSIRASARGGRRTPNTRRLRGISKSCKATRRGSRRSTRSARRADAAK